MSRSRGRRSRNQYGFNKPAVQNQIAQIIGVVGDPWVKEDIYRLLQETNFNTELVVNKIITGEVKPNPDTWHTVESKAKTKKGNGPSHRGGSRGRGRGRRNHQRGRGRGGYIKRDGPPGGRRYTPAERARMGLDVAPPPKKETHHHHHHPKNGVHAGAGGVNGSKPHTIDPSSQETSGKPVERTLEPAGQQVDGVSSASAAAPSPSLSSVKPTGPSSSGASAATSAGGTGGAGARTNPKHSARYRGETAGVVSPSTSDPSSSADIPSSTASTEPPRVAMPEQPSGGSNDAKNGGGSRPVADILPSGLGTADDLASVRLQFGNFGLAPSGSPSSAGGEAPVKPANEGAGGGAGAPSTASTAVKSDSGGAATGGATGGSPTEGASAPAGGRGKREDPRNPGGPSAASATASGAPHGGAGAYGMHASHELAESAQYLRDPAAMAGFPPYAVSPYMYGQYGFDDPNAAGAHGVPPHSMFPYGPMDGYPSPAGYRGATSPPFSREPYGGGGGGAPMMGPGDASRKPYGAPGAEDAAPSKDSTKVRGEASGGKAAPSSAAAGAPDEPRGASGGPAGGPPVGVPGPDGKSSPIPHSPHGYPGYGMGAGPAMHPYYPYPIGGGFPPYGPPSGSGSNPAYSRYPYPAANPYYPPKYGMSAAAAAAGYGGPSSAHNGPYDEANGASGASGAPGEYPGMAGNSSSFGGWPENESKGPREGAPSGTPSSGGPPSASPGGGRGPAVPPQHAGPAYPSHHHHDRLTTPYGDDHHAADPSGYSYLPSYGAPPSAGGFGSYGMPPSAGAPNPTEAGGQYS